MDTAMNVAVSSQLALERRLATLADNVANANTTGFRATQIRFDEALDRTPALNGNVATSFVSRGVSFANTAHGGLEQTGNALDFAINGEACFAVRTPAGTAVTRDGRFTMQPDGAVVSAATGHPVLDAGGGDLRLDPNAGPVVADAAGRLRQGGEGIAGSIGLFAYTPGADPTRVGTSAILTKGEPLPVTDGQGASVIQGSLERSNVNPVREMTRLITLHRTFDNLAALLRDAEGASEMMVRTLGGQR